MSEYYEELINATVANQALALRQRTTFWPALPFDYSDPEANPWMTPDQRVNLYGRRPSKPTIDLVGKVNNHLEVLDEPPKPMLEDWFYPVLCSCGNRTWLPMLDIDARKHLGVGCMVGDCDKADNPVTLCHFSARHAMALQLNRFFANNQSVLDLWKSTEKVGYDVAVVHLLTHIHNTVGPLVVGAHWANIHADDNGALSAQDPGFVPKRKSWYQEMPVCVDPNDVSGWLPLELAAASLDVSEGDLMRLSLEQPPWLLVESLEEQQ